MNRCFMVIRSSITIVIAVRYMTECIGGSIFLHVLIMFPPMTKNVKTYLMKPNELASSVSIYNVCAFAFIMLQQTAI